jgi:hypothetical protein
LEWIRKGIGLSDEKGATRLMNVKTQAENTNVYDLNVEVNADGTVKTIAPLTNAPAAK